MCTLKVLLVALWCLSVSVKSYAEVYSGSCGESVNWSLDTETRLLEITGSGEMEDYDYYDDTPWYLHRFSINKCTIENGVTSIGDWAFSLCTGLASITIPNSVTSIGDYAFNACTGLTSITIGNSVTSIGGGAFCYCTGLTSITIPESVTSIGKSAFDGCTGLTSITIPEGVTSIEKFAFRYCTGLTSITIPESVTSIGNSAFSGCTGLTSITIPEGVTSIGFRAFHLCTGLTSIAIPESVTSIGNDAFSGCTNIKTIYCRSQEPPVCGNSALNGIDTSNCTLFVPEGAEALYKVAYQWKEFLFIEEITGIDTPRADDGKDTTYDIYDMSGRTVRKAATTTDGLKPGLYIINGRKVLVE